MKPGYKIHTNSHLDNLTTLFDYHCTSPENRTRPETLETHPTLKSSCSVYFLLHKNPFVSFFSFFYIQ
ncbi:hypothetical protein HanPI659440_Chr17g0679991 [Helianthus annuus]|nr:hypothetical protein HanPI659440_Chr17g0679991 [Helianthus annuus]